MSTLIREHRTRRGLTMRQLADRLGVTPAAIQQFEIAENAGSIKLKTLERVLEALNLRYQPAVEESSPPLRREEALNLALHREVAKKLIDDPEKVSSRARANLPKIKQNVKGPTPVGLIEEWERLLNGPTNDLLGAMLDESRHGSELRQNTPFAGALTQGERLLVIRGARR